MPDIKPKEEGYEIKAPFKFIEFPNFQVSNLSCPIMNLTIQPATDHTVNDFKSDLGLKPEVFSKFDDELIRIKMPNFSSLT